MTPACLFCGAPVDRWPSRSCEEPWHHTLAIHDCDCGEAFTVADATASPSKHSRCYLIGSRS